MYIPGICYIMHIPGICYICYIMYIPGICYINKQSKELTLMMMNKAETQQ